MKIEKHTQYLQLHDSTDPKQKELGIRILDLYEKAQILGLEIKWPDPPLKEKILSLVEKTFDFQMESLVQLIEEYKSTDPLSVSFLPPPYNKRNVPSFLKKCAKHKLKEPIELPQSMKRQLLWCAYFSRKSLHKYFSMELIPKGTFRMGHPQANLGGNVVHRVQLTNDFWMSRTPMSQKKFKDLCVLIKEKESDFAIEPEPSHFVGPLRPVDSISWFDCLRFCNALSRLEGKEEVYDFGGLTRIQSQEDFTKLKCNIQADGYRLPTEAEWEYAARANRNFLYSGSNNSEEVTWNVDNSVVVDRNCTISVASKRPNAWGLFDMSGNIDEWCWDGFEAGYYAKSPKRNPMGGKTAPTRVVRGGAYDAKPLAVWGRNHANPVRARDDIGFRLVRTVCY